MHASLDSSFAPTMNDGSPVALQSTFGGHVQRTSTVMHDPTGLESTVVPLSLSPMSVDAPTAIAMIATMITPPVIRSGFSLFDRATSRRGAGAAA